ncbi:PLD nuclease N-terminal domain-containing protein [Kineosporia mesophila]|uniref:PLD nuclease N-terminal domain-containing protein n=1 Tax=Kineosporia mesophila TaxID=566012 RepID=UPI001E3CB1F2|nr:PLD nuclease N-terminal domain-containing protein [Kineosporia mesophila]MCD5354829.1 PLD nuclease N-terminal domain-containing protein [Kineosporia mesophila]
MARVLFVLAVIGVTIYAAIDCLRSADDEIRTLPKPLWLLFIVLIPLLGGVTWILFGRQSSPGNQPPRRLRTVGPDDDPEFLRNLDVRRPKPDDGEKK